MGINRHSSRRSNRRFHSTSSQNISTSETTSYSLTSIDEYEERRTSLPSDRTIRRRHARKRRGRKMSYSDRILQSLSRIPTKSFVAFTLFLFGLGSFTGGTFMGLRKARDIFGFSEMFNLLDHLLPGIIAAMLAICTTLVCVGHIANDAASRSLLRIKDSKINASKTSLLVLIISYMLGILWIMITSVVAIPLCYMVLLVFDKETEWEINGFDVDLADSNFINIEEKRKGLLVCCIITYISSLLITTSLESEAECSGIVSTSCLTCCTYYVCNQNCKRKKHNVMPSRYIQSIFDTEV